MSLWPFEQTLSQSGTDSILDEYYVIFRSLKDGAVSTNGDCANGSVSYTHLDVYKRQIGTSIITTT